jgi:hypothetical protein
MRSPLVRLAAVLGSIAALASCDTGPVTPKFGNGIAGGSTGTTPVTPPNPNTPDTGSVGVFILDPATTGQLVNVGDSLLVQVRIFDDRQVQSVRIQGMKYSGDPNLGTLVESVRYPTVFIPSPGGLPFRTNPPLVDTTVRRYLKPAVPVDSSLDSLVIMAIVTDAAGNVDTATRRVNLVSGPSVVMLAPNPGDSVPQNVPMNFSVRVQSNQGVRIVRMRVQGETTWPAAAALDTTYIDTIAGTQRDVTVAHSHLVPLQAPAGGRITITATATDITGNPGSAAPLVVFVRQLGTSAPRVTQVIPDRMETTDSITIVATGDGIATVGFIVRDLAGTVLKDSNTAVGAIASNVRRDMRINLPTTHQGRSVRVSSYAIDQQNVRGYSVAANVTVSQTDSLLAHTDSSLIVYGQTFALPRSGTVGDIQVDTTRSRVLISNMNANRLEVWQNASRTFDVDGVAVGSQPWGMALSVHRDTLLVANSGGTNVSRVFLGTVGGPVSTMREDLARRIRTRTNFLWVITESFDAANAVHFAVGAPRMFSDRPQFIGQTSDTLIYFSTRPTTTAPEGTVRYLDPRQPEPDLRTFVFVRSLASTTQNYVFVDVDSVASREGGQNIPDTLYVFDHLPGTTQASVMVKAPVCNNSGVFINGRTACIGGAADPNFDPRFPSGLPQGALAALFAIRNYDATCAPNCSDATVYENVDPVGITDTTFVAQSADRNWIAFGQGNSNPGFLMMGQATPNNPAGPFFSPLITQFDLTNQAAERVFGVAIDSTGLTIGAHGAQSYFSSVDNPFHLRLQGIYADAGSGGAGIAYHPRANGTGSPTCERLAFVADGSKAIHATDLAFFIRRGRFDLKHQLYGPIRVTRRLAGDDPTIVLKLYGVSLTGGLTVIDLRAQDIIDVPGEPDSPGCP